MINESNYILLLLSGGGVPQRGEVVGEINSFERAI